MPNYINHNLEVFLPESNNGLAIISTNNYTIYWSLSGEMTIFSQSEKTHRSGRRLLSFSKKYNPSHFVELEDENATMNDVKINYMLSG